MGRRRKALGRPLVIGVLTVAVAGLGFGLYWFQPWKLWQDETVQEALPGTVATSAAPTAAPARSGPPSPDAEPRTLASGVGLTEGDAPSGPRKPGRRAAVLGDRQLLDLVRGLRPRLVSLGRWRGGCS